MSFRTEGLVLRVAMTTKTGGDNIKHRLREARWNFRCFNQCKNSDIRNGKKYFSSVSSAPAYGVN